LIDKENLLKIIIKDYEKKLEYYKSSMDDSQKEANMHKGAMESRYDTFKEEAQMLKDGFAKQYQQINEILKILSSYKYNILNKKFNKVLPGTVVKCLINEDEEKFFFIIKGIFLNEYKFNNIKITTLNSDTPFAKKLLNLEKDDEVKFNEDIIEIIEII
jgi:transcription elongation GreA/GreB family factor